MCGMILSPDAGQRQRARAPSQPRDQRVHLPYSTVTVLLAFLEYCALSMFKVR